MVATRRAGAAAPCAQVAGAARLCGAAGHGWRGLGCSTFRLLGRGGYSCGRAANREGCRAAVGGCVRVETWVHGGVWAGMSGGYEGRLVRLPVLHPPRPRQPGPIGRGRPDTCSEDTRTGGDMPVMGTCQSWGHASHGDMPGMGTCQRRGHARYRDMPMEGTCQLWGHANGGDMPVMGTCQLRGHASYVDMPVMGPEDCGSGGLARAVLLTRMRLTRMRLTRMRLTRMRRRTSGAAAWSRPPSSCTTPRYPPPAPSTPHPWLSATPFRYPSGSLPIFLPRRASLSFCLPLPLCPALPRCALPAAPLRSSRCPAAHACARTCVPQGTRPREIDRWAP